LKRGRVGRGDGRSIRDGKKLKGRLLRSRR
jgi:hypothetical protein